MSILKLHSKLTGGHCVSDKKILIVEDEMIVAMSIEQKLSDMGYVTVGTTDTGEEAVRCASKLKPDLILMDIVLKGKIDGIKAAKQIKDRLNIPIIYLTAYSYNEIVKRTHIKESYEYLVKPFKKSELKDCIEMALANHKFKKIETINKTLTECHDLVLAASPYTQISGHEN